ncbi:MAG: hypothetical protein WCT14_17645 [Treponemataceae bacterium]
MAGIKKTILRLAFALGLLVASAMGVFAEDVKIETDESALFGDAEEGVEKVAEEAKGKAVQTFLKTETVRIGGTYTGTLESAFTWTDPWYGNRDPLAPEKKTLLPTADAKVFFDARPNDYTRYYGSVKAFWPYKDSSNFQLFELFTDFNWNDQFNFRFGKHTVKWGVGYFWSPADVINVAAIDVTDPTAQREGPVNLRLHVPIANTQNNIWAYAILPRIGSTADAAKIEPDDLAFAAKYEFLVGNYEIGAGAYYRRDYAPKAMLTATGSLWRLNLFGEAVASWGSDKTWVTDAATLSTTKHIDGVYFSGTAGFSYVNSTENINAFFQYFYNGDGYEDADRKSLISQARTALSVAPTASVSETLTLALKGLIYQSGKHYAGAYLSKAEAGSTKLTLSILAIANLSDLSGFVQPSVSWEFFERCYLAFSPSFYWSTDALWGAGKDGEYVVIAGGPSITLSLKATLGSGSF